MTLVSTKTTSFRLPRTQDRDPKERGKGGSGVSSPSSGLPRPRVELLVSPLPHYPCKSRQTNGEVPFVFQPCRPESDPKPFSPIGPSPLLSDNETPYLGYLRSLSQYPILNLWFSPSFLLLGWGSVSGTDGTTGPPRLVRPSPTPRPTSVSPVRGPSSCKDVLRGSVSVPSPVSKKRWQPRLSDTHRWCGTRAGSTC